MHLKAVLTTMIHLQSQQRWLQVNSFSMSASRCRICSLMYRV